MKTEDLKCSVLLRDTLAKQFTSVEDMVRHKLSPRGVLSVFQGLDTERHIHELTESLKTAGYLHHNDDADETIRREPFHIDPRPDVT